MQPGAKRKASGLVGFLLTPFRARSHIVDKLGARWAILADSLIVGGALGLIAALAFDLPGEARLGIFAGLVGLAGVAGAAIGAMRKARPEPEKDTQP
jgi:hypothetical protein